MKTNKPAELVSISDLLQTNQRDKQPQNTLGRTQSTLGWTQGNYRQNLGMKLNYLHHLRNRRVISHKMF